MEHLYKIRDSFADYIGYISPASKRRRTINAGSPTSRVASTRQTYVSVTEPRSLGAGAGTTGDLPTIDHSSMEKALMARPTKKRRRAVNDEYIYEAKEQDLITPSDSASNIPGPSDDDGSTSLTIPDPPSSKKRSATRDVEEDDEELNLKASDERGIATDETLVEPFVITEDDFINRKQYVKSCVDASWSEDEKVIFESVAMRGFEPLLPASWQEDFKMWPAALFTNEGNTRINSKCSTSRRGK
jgi:hypothetical protein